MGESIVVLLMFVGSAAVAISFSPIGRAIAGRISANARTGMSDPALLAELDDLRARQAEMEERLDFAERQLVSGVPGRPLAPTPEA